MNTQIKRINGNGAAPAPSFSGMVDRFFQDTISNFFGNGTLQSGQPGVPVNVRETDKAIEMEFVAPGLRKEDFKVKVNGDLLTVSFEQDAESTEQRDGWLRREYSARSFSRSFHIDESFDVSGISARYADGILRVSVPRKEGAQPLHRLIDVN